MKKETEELTPNERLNIKTSFILLFPMVVVAGIAVYSNKVGISAIAIGMAIFQFLLIKNFVEDYYRRIK